MQAKINSLLRKYPQQAEGIRTSLIGALEKVGAEYEALIRAGQQVPEDLAEYSNALTDAVSALRDPRSASALLTTGGMEGLADICPSAVDLIIERAHAPEIYWQGLPQHINAFAVRTLGFCLERPAMMRANPELESKIKRELLTDLESRDSSVREVAAEVLVPLRKDPEVNAKLQRVAALDPHYGPDGVTPEGMAYGVREAARQALTPPDGLSYYVTRRPDTGACQVRPSSQALLPEAIVGPESADLVRRVMCSHYDPVSQDPTLCRKIEPANACSH